MENQREKIQVAARVVTDLRDKKATYQIKHIDSSGRMADEMRVIDTKLRAQEVLVKANENACSILADSAFDHKPCKECKLLTSARRAKETIEEAKENVSYIRKTLDGLQRECDAAKERARTIIENYNHHLREATRIHDDMKAEFNECLYEKVIRGIEELSSLPEQASKIEAAKKVNAAYEEEHAQIEKKIQELSTKISGLSGTEAHGETLTKKLHLIASGIQDFEAERDSKASFIKEMMVKKGALNAAIEGATKARDEAERVKGEISELIEWHNVYSSILRAFSRDGIPQYVVDTSLPQLHDELDKVLKVFDGRFTIRFRTQGTTKAGDIRERMDIDITNNEGHTHPIESFSGGEQKLLNTAVRIALAVFQAKRQGAGLKVFAADEAFDALDPDRSHGVQEVFRGLEDSFNQIFVGTHSPDLIADISTQYHLSLDENGRTKVDTRE